MSRVLEGFYTVLICLGLVAAFFDGFREKP